MRKASVFQPLLFGVLCLAATWGASGQQASSPPRAKGILEVVVSDESGQHAAGATVSVPGYRCTTGLNGTCRFSLLPGRYAVLVNKSGFRGRRVTVGVRPGETATTEVRMHKLAPALPPRK